MTWEFRYQLLSAPQPRVDGSRDVIHTIGAQGSEDAGDWADVPGRTNKGVPVPADDLATVMAMPDGTSQQKTTKNAAYKQLLVASLDRTSVPATGWSESAMEEVMENNQQSAAQATAADEYLTGTLSLSYPVPFVL